MACIALLPRQELENLEQAVIRETREIILENMSFLKILVLLWRFSIVVFRQLITISFHVILHPSINVYQNHEEFYKEYFFVSTVC